MLLQLRGDLNFLQKMFYNIRYKGSFLFRGRNVFALKLFPHPVWRDPMRIIANRTVICID